MDEATNEPLEFLRTVARALDIYWVAGYLGVRGDAVKEMIQPRSQAKRRYLAQAAKDEVMRALAEARPELEKILRNGRDRSYMYMGHKNAPKED
jgi:hypothetical protein